MDLQSFIAQRIARNEQASFSKFILRLATIATAISVAVMVVAVSVVLGFKTKIREKMFVFWGHAQVTMFHPDPASLIGDVPFKRDSGLINEIKRTPGVSAVHPFILKASIVKAAKGLEGIKLKGVESSYPLRSNDAITFEGRPLNFSGQGYSSDLILSQTTLNRLELKIGSTVLLVFFDPEQSAPLVRKLTVVGSFHTGMEEVDQGFGICDARLLRNVNQWQDSDVSALQIVMDDHRASEQISNQIYQQYIQPPMSVATIKDIYPFIFSWLDFQNVNAALILIIMAVVAAINMATALLIYILERTQMIGTLKALGMRNWHIQKIFLYQAGRVAIKGIILGTLIGLLLCWTQHHFQVLKLDEEVYYIKAAPVVIDWPSILLIDLSTLVFCLLIMLIPALIVRTVQIVKALKFK